MNRVSTPKLRARATGTWGLFAGVIGSFCCLGPSAAVLLGLGSSSALFSVQFDQTWSLVVSAVLLLGGLVHMKWRAQAVNACRTIRWRQPLLMLAAFVVSYGLLGVLLPLFAAQMESRAATAPVVAAASSATVDEPAIPEAPALHRLTLIIEKMNCPPCAAKVRNRLQQKPAVRELHAEAYNEQVIITYDPQQTTGKQLMMLFPRQYGVTLVSDEPLP